VYETETSPVSTRFAGPTALAYDDDDDADTGAVSKDVDTDAVSEDEVHKFVRKSFGEIASPYLSPYVHKSGVLDAEYGLRKVGDIFYRQFRCDGRYSDFYIRNKHFKGTRGLWE